MSECPKCGRTKCARPGSVTCRHYAEIYERGMREGFAIAEGRATCQTVNEEGDFTETYIDGIYVESAIDWTDAHTELERRLRGEA